MITLGLAPPARRIVRHSYTGMHTAAAEAYAEHGLMGAATGAVETAARLYQSAFQVATVEPAVPPLTPAVLGTIARRLITGGESVHVIDVDGAAVVLTEAASWSVDAGGPDPATWRYQCVLPGPHDSADWAGPADAVVHCRYATNSVEPWRGIAPLVLAGTTGRLAVNVERALRWETEAAAQGEVGGVVPLPQDASDDDKNDDDDPLAPLKRTLRTLKGRLGLVETTSHGHDHGRAAAPQDDWKPRRIGPAPPDSMVELRAQVEESVLSALGIPPGLARAQGGESRESYRRWYAASVLPLAAVVETELRHKLDVLGLRLDFASLAAADVHGRARAWRSLAGNEATLPVDTARRIVGL